MLRVEYCFIFITVIINNGNYYFLIYRKVDICHICKEEGPVITCDDCSKNYHLSCLNPPKRAPPKRNWTCFSCRQTSCKGKY